jgi:hypothetical protein
LDWQWFCLCNSSVDKFSQLMSQQAAHSYM